MTNLENNQQQRKALQVPVLSVQSQKVGGFQHPLLVQMLISSFPADSVWPGRASSQCLRLSPALESRGLQLWLALLFSAASSPDEIAPRAVQVRHTESQSLQACPLPSHPHTRLRTRTWPGPTSSLRPCSYRHITSRCCFSF